MVNDQLPIGILYTSEYAFKSCSYLGFLDISYMPGYSWKFLMKEMP